MYSTSFAYSFIGQLSLSKYCFKATKSFEPIVENILVNILLTFMSPVSSYAVSPVLAPIRRELMSIPELCICKGYSDNVSSSTDLIYLLTPFDSDSISAIPIIPIEPANDVKIVLPFLVFKLLKLSDREVKKDIDVFLKFLCSGFFCFSFSIM